jgi:ABC-type nitrate/sulfonate/bicarbonate transport system substrate-binding protein
MMPAAVTLSVLLSGCGESDPETSIRDATDDLRETQAELQDVQRDYARSQSALTENREEAAETLEQMQPQLEAEVQSNIAEAQESLKSTADTVNAEIERLMQQATAALEQQDWDRATSAVDRLRELTLGDEQVERLDGIMRRIDEARSAAQTLHEAAETLNATEFTK